MDELIYREIKTERSKGRCFLKPAEKKHMGQLAAFLAAGLGIYMAMCLALRMFGVL